MARLVATLIAAFGPAASAMTLSAMDARVNGPTEKVVSLLTDMKAQVEKDLADDQDLHQKRTCWCETNKKAKDEAVEAAETKIAELEAFIEEAAGTEGVLKTEIPALADGIVEDQDSLETATALRAKENEEFEAAAADSKECISTLGKALDVLSKVQLVQKDKMKPMLVQLQMEAAALQPPTGALGDRFTSVMQQDLWDVMGSLDASGAPRHHFLAAIAEEPTGAAAGAKSYNSRSGGILGILSQLKEDFENSLSAAEKAEATAAAEFASLKAAKEGEIASAKAQKLSKEVQLSDLLAKAAQAKGDVESTKNALSADQRFLLELIKTCTESAEAFDERSKMRTDEVQALGEAISILRNDDARDLFGKTMNFMQTSSVNSDKQAAQNKAVKSAMSKIMKIARKHHNWILATLAVHVRLDAFTKVIEMMDKMVAELKTQQKAEDEKIKVCNKEIDETEDTVKVKSNEKESLEATKVNLENSIATLEKDIETLNAEVEDMKVSLKQAGEERKASNQIFQQSVADQRATIQILNKATARLQKFYAPKLVQVRQEPGSAISEAPPAAKEYEASGGAGGVVQLLQKIISEAESEEAKIVAEEQNDQEAYAGLASDMTASVNADQSAIMEKTKLMEQAKGEASETAAALTANTDELAKLGDMLNGMHLDCDWLLKYYDARQKARAEEMDAIAEAKAILSGADFGSAEE